MLQACLNGTRTRQDHPRVPVTPGDVAEDAVRAVAAGADELHVHPRDAEGRESLAPDDVAATVTALREAVPGVPLGLTTGLWAAGGDPARRLEQVAGWHRLPDYVSLNWHEEGADELAELLLDRGVGIEAGLWHVEGVAAWDRSPHRDRCLRVLLELPDGLVGEAVEGGFETLAGSLLNHRETLAGSLRDHRPPVLLHGEGSSTWPALRLARADGLDTRIGLEDTLTLPDGTEAPDNAALIETVVTPVRGWTGG